MRLVTAAHLEAVFAFPDLIAALGQAFRGGVVTPVRHHHAMPRDATLLLMPAWTEGAAGAFLGVKVVTVFPGNASLGKASVQGLYLLASGETGEPLALIDGPELTLWRTAAASALAASHLARADARSLVMVGAGALAPHLIAAHASVRPIREVKVWARRREAAADLAARLAGRPYRVEPASDLESAVRGADIVSCATLSTEPLVKGEWLKPGAHLDLVGAFRPDMREADDEAVRRARLFCDTRGGALKEGGDLAQPLSAGLIGETDVVADLAELARGDKPGRRSEAEVTLFKSVGTALEDLAAAVLAFKRLATA